MKNYLILFVAAALLGSSCGYIGGKRVRGNGNVRSEERMLSAFSAVQVSGAMDVILVQDSVQKVKIEADDNLIPYIVTSIMGDKLEVRTKRGYNLRPTGKMKIYVSSPSFSKVDVSGACNIFGEGVINNNRDISLEVSGAGDIKLQVNAPKVSAEVSGSGSMELKGETRDFEAELSGAGNIHCFDLKSENTKLRISGAGDAEVFASVSLDARVSGAGSVRYKGNATTVNQRVSGAGSVKKAD